MSAPTHTPTTAGWQVRAARPQDVDALQAFIGALSLRSRVQRFFAPLRQLPPALVQALQRGDPAQRFVVAERDGQIGALGQYAADPQRPRCEVALVVDDILQGHGLGRRVLERVLAEARAAGLREAVLETMSDNRAMRGLARRCGFVLMRHPEDPELVLGERSLQPV